MSNNTIQAGTTTGKVGPQINIDVQDVIMILSQKLAKAEADGAIKEATNAALMKRVNDLEQALTASMKTNVDKSSEEK